MATSWHSYPDVYNLGHKALDDFIKEPVMCQEKVDGSQFSFGRFDGVLRIRSKGKEMVLDAPEKMFEQAVLTVLGLDLHDGWTYRGEYLRIPKHNSLEYSRVPAGHIILFDINDVEEGYLCYGDVCREANDLGLEVVPVLYDGLITLDRLIDMMETESILGGTTIEGVVMKNYKFYGHDKKVIMAKYVSEAMREKHSREWKKSNPGHDDILASIVKSLKTVPRWEKSIQHLRDNGDLENDPCDIGKLLKEICSDVHKEEEEWIKEQLFKWAWPQISRGLTRGFPEYYKDKLVDEQLSK